ncbi:MAG: Hsp20/alpha crystallin family protein [Chloroflexi bacterium]|nr:Hsp20/alpha crystallin family protein [Chloroflexota bacterium]
MSINIYRPFGGAMSIRDLMNRLFEESFVHPERLLTGIAYQHPMELCEKDDEFIFRMCLPGLKPEDVDITIAQDTLTITGELKQPGWQRQMGQQMEQQTGSQQQQGQQQGPRGRSAECLFSEILYGSFTRRVTLPTQIDADKASAEFDNGMLMLHLPKAAAAKPKRLQVKAVAKS